MQCRLLRRSSDSPVDPCSCRRGQSFPSTYLLVSCTAPLFFVCPELSLVQSCTFTVCPEMCMSPEGAFSLSSQPLGYCWRTQKCRNFCLTHAFLEVQEAWGGLLTKLQSRRIAVGSPTVSL